MNVWDRLEGKLQDRKSKNLYRSLFSNESLIDFCSNDYLGLARFSASQHLEIPSHIHLKDGSTGSRLLSGHYELLEELEATLCRFHKADAALVFNSGYTANLGLIATVCRKNDLILYDELVHASIHDGMRMSQAESISFKHNDPNDLKDKLTKATSKNVFVIIEAVYSMDGDVAPLVEIAELCNKSGVNLIVDEAHSNGVIGPKGAGLCVLEGLEDAIFARIYTFGKGIGSHGAAILGKQLLKDYLINFCRPLIFSTAPTPHCTWTTLQHYSTLQQDGEQRIQLLHKNIDYFRSKTNRSQENFLNSHTAIQGVIISGNEHVMEKAYQLKEAGIDARPIRIPSVEKGKERIRICLHSFNTSEEIDQLLKVLK